VTEASQIRATGARVLGAAYFFSVAHWVLPRERLPGRDRGPSPTDKWEAADSGGAHHLPIAALADVLAA
jgi:hypothetical protein